MFPFIVVSAGLSAAPARLLQRRLDPPSLHLGQRVAICGHTLAVIDPLRDKTEYIDTPLIEDLQCELRDAWLEGAGDLATGGGRTAGDGAQGRCAAYAERLRSRALRAADRARQKVVGVVEDVVQFGTELNLDALKGGVELLVQSEIGLVEGWCPAGIATRRAERAELITGRVLDRRKNEGGEVDIVH